MKRTKKKDRTLSELYRGDPLLDAGSIPLFTSRPVVGVITTTVTVGNVSMTLLNWKEPLSAQRCYFAAENDGWEDCEDPEPDPEKW